MTPNDIAHMQRTFGRIALDKERFATEFYERLFVIAPAVRPMFNGDMATQGQKLMSMIATAVGHLKQPQAIELAVTQLGARHKGYGVAGTHYAHVADALLWTLERSLGNDFTPEVKAAWVSMYASVAAAMQRT